VPRIALALAAAAVLLGRPVHAQNPWLLEWLADYAAGRHAEVAGRMASLASARVLEFDLERQAPAWLQQKGADPVAQRRVLAAFALEAAIARLDQGTDATKLLEWGCRQVRRIPQPGPIEQHWHRAAFAVFAGAADSDGLEAHIGHVKLQFPTEPRLTFQRAVAAELRTVPALAGLRTASEMEKRRQEAARRFREVTDTDASTRAEADLRLAHVQIALAAPDAALEALARLDEPTIDPYLVYLARLFRGLALEQLGRLDEARAAYEAALAAAPGTPSAAMRLAALEFRQGQRDVSDRIVAELIDRRAPVADPWWSYWSADFRHLTRLLAALRGSVR